MGTLDGPSFSFWAQIVVLVRYEKREQERGARLLGLSRSEGARIVVLSWENGHSRFVVLDSSNTGLFREHRSADRAECAPPSWSLKSRSSQMSTATSSSRPSGKHMLWEGPQRAAHTIQRPSSHWTTGAATCWVSSHLSSLLGRDRFSIHFEPGNPRVDSIHSHSRKHMSKY